jgi:hypothetical protein
MTHRERRLGIDALCQQDTGSAEERGPAFAEHAVAQGGTESPEAYRVDDDGDRLPAISTRLLLQLPLQAPVEVGEALLPSRALRRRAFSGLGLSAVMSALSCRAK